MSMFSARPASSFCAEKASRSEHCRPSTSMIWIHCPALTVYDCAVAASILRSSSSGRASGSGSTGSSAASGSARSTYTRTGDGGFGSSSSTVIPPSRQSTRQTVLPVAVNSAASPAADQSPNSRATGSASPTAAGSSNHAVACCRPCRSTTRSRSPPRSRRVRLWPGSSR